MDITDPIAIRYCNEVFRPLSEELNRALSKVDLVITDLNPSAKNLLSLFPDTDDVIKDNREAEGVSQLTSKDCLRMIKICQSLRALADAVKDTQGNDIVHSRAILRKFAVN